MPWESGHWRERGERKRKKLRVCGCGRGRTQSVVVSLRIHTYKNTYPIRSNARSVAVGRPVETDPSILHTCQQERVGSSRLPCKRVDGLAQRLVWAITLLARGNQLRDLITHVAHININGGRTNVDRSTRDRGTDLGWACTNLKVRIMGREPTMYRPCTCTSVQSMSCKTSSGPVLDVVSYARGVGVKSLGMVECMGSRERPFQCVIMGFSRPSPRM